MLTDRAYRYRANHESVRPIGKKICKICGSSRNVGVDHIDGFEENSSPRNLRWLCKSCNTRLGIQMAKKGKGRRTRQFNPLPLTITEGLQSGIAWAAGSRMFDEATGKKRKKNIWPFDKGQLLGSREYHGKARRIEREELPRIKKSGKRGKSGIETENDARLKRKLSDRDIESKLEAHYARGGTLKEFLNSNPSYVAYGPTGRKIEEFEADRLSDARTKSRGLSDEWVRLYEVVDGEEKFVGKIQARKHNPERFKVARRGNYIQPFAVEDTETIDILYKTPKLMGGKTTSSFGASTYKTFKTENQAQAYANKLNIKSNPGSMKDAESLSAKWHGRPTQKVTEIEETETYSENLAELGDLEELGVLGADLESRFTISFKTRRPKVCAADENNIEFVGGDMSLNDTPDGVEREGKQLVPLGYCIQIVYVADKHHLEGSNGYPESYEHWFGEEFYKDEIDSDEFKNTEDWFEQLLEDGVVDEAIEDGLIPLLVYNKTDKKLLVVGGQYTIEDVGIKN